MLTSWYSQSSHIMLGAVSSVPQPEGFLSDSRYRNCCDILQSRSLLLLSICYRPAELSPSAIIIHQEQSLAAIPEVKTEK